MDVIRKLSRPSLAGPNPQATHTLRSRSTARIFVPLLALVTLFIALLPAPASAATPEPSATVQVRAMASSDAVIYAVANDRFTTARLSLTDAPLQARATSIGSWEEFRFEPVSTGVFAIKSLANGKYVTATLSATDAPLQARATSIGSWEKFEIVDWYSPEGFFLYSTLRSLANGKYVTATLSATDAPLKARATSIGSWEQFIIV